MLQIIMIITTIISFYIGMRRIFVFIKIEKYKKRYFFYVSFGALFKCRVIRLCIVMKKNRDGTYRIMLVKRKGRTGMIMDLSKAARIDPDIGKMILPAVYVEKLDLELTVGLDDAKDTCLFCGFVQAAINALLPIIEDHICLKKTTIKTTPRFKKEKMAVALGCILKIDLVHIIIRYFKI